MENNDLYTRDNEMAEIAELIHDQTNMFKSTLV